MKMIKHIIKNNLRAFHIIRKTIPSLVFMTMFKSIVLAIIEPLMTIWYFRYVLDAVMMQVPIRQILTITLIMCILVVGKQLYSSWYDKVFYPAKALILRKKMREEMYHKLVDIDISNYDNSESYEKISRAMNEIDSRILSVFQTAANTIESSVILITSLGIVLQIDLFILLFSILSLIISILFNIGYNNIDYHSRMAQVSDNREIDYVHRILNLKDYSQDIRTTGLSSLLFGMLNRAYLNLHKTYKQENPKLMIYDALPQAIILTSTIASIFYIIFRISLGYISVGSFAALLNGSQSVTATISGLFVFIPQFQQHSLYLDNVFEILDCQNYITSGKKNFHGDFSTIEFKNVSFQYPNSDIYVLKDISFKIHKGEMVGIVGHNGAGKSTLIKLLLRLYDPTEGVILLDGVDYKEYNTQDLRNSIGTVFQNYFVYPFTIYENIAMGYVEAEQNTKIDIILKDISLYEKIHNIDLNMNKCLSNEFENGIVLSGGEQQKVAIARVLYKANPIVVMDEPSSALDPISEAEIIDLVYQQFKGRAVFMISHRLSTTKNCDIILHMSKGKIIEYGSHEQLMKHGGAYCDLFNLQAERYMSDSKE